jgi:hypothetical protein
VRIDRRALLLILAVCACVSATAVAQVRYRPTETGPWRPWSFAAIASARQSRGATAADVQAFQTRLQALAAIVKSAPAVSTPIGFAGELWGSLAAADTPASGQPPDRALPLAGALSFGAFPLIEFTRGGRLVNEDLKGGETELLQFVVNQLDGSIYGGSRPQGWGAASIDAFVEPEPGAAVAGLPRVGDVFVVRKNPKPLWLPFPIAEALQPIAVERRALYENRRDGYAKEVAEFAAWRTPASRAARRAEWQKSAAQMPKGGAEFLANMEKADPQIEAASEARLKPGGPDETAVRAAERELQEVDGLLAALSPEGRLAPSCYDQRAARLADRFRALAGAPASCRPLVRPNRDYFDRTLPRSTPQVVMLASFTRCLRSDAAAATVRGGCVINRALVDTMDWNAVRAWLDH